MNTKILTALAGSSLVAIATATPAFAQNTQTAQAQPPSGDDTVAAAAAEEGKNKDEIIITGTQIRGIKPVGSNVLTQTREDIKETGVQDTNQVLAQLPQSNFFLTLPQPGGGVIAQGTPRIPVNRPNLRNIPGTTTGSGSPTLVLIDGHRVVPSGLEQATVDAGVVPVGVLERTEVILDGVSAVYGSDAVAGVINFITRKRFDGIEVNARYGFGDNYWQTDASVTAGKSWGSGGITFNYEFAKSKGLQSGDRDWRTPLNWIPYHPAVVGPPAVAAYGSLAGLAVDDLSCDVPNVTNATASGGTGTIHTHVSGAGLAGPSGTNADGGNYQFCDGSFYSTLNPAQVRHSGFLVFEQDITDAIKLNVTALYSNRKQVADSGPFTATASIFPSAVVPANATAATILVTGPPGTLFGNPYYRCDTTIAQCNTFNANGTLNTASRQRVSFSYGPLFGNDGTNSGISTTRVELGQITPELTADLGSDWQVRASYAYGKSKTSVDQTRIDTIAQTSVFNGTTLTTALNPYNITDPRQNFTLLGGLPFHHHSDGKFTFNQARVAADGPIFTLPGGQVRVAVGAEWMKTDFKRRRTDDNTLLVTQYFSASASSKSAFGEIVVPVVGPDNGMPGIQGLVLSASGRYDDYGQYGDTFNPKFALTYNPVKWITVRANWGKSFRAPNVVDKLAAGDGSLIRCIQQSGCVAAIQNPTNINPNYNFTATGNNFTMLYITGAVPDLQPETSKSWSIGADVSPPFIPGLTLSATYWKIDFKNFISTPNITANVTPIFTIPGLGIICYDPPPAGQPNNSATQVNHCTQQQFTDFANLSPLSGPAVLNFVQSPSQNYAIAILLDGRARNLGGAKITGADFSARYRHDTGFGSVDANVNISIPIKNDFQLIPGGAISDELLTGDPKFQMNASVGANIGGFRAQATWRHQSGYLADEYACTLNNPPNCPTVATGAAGTPSARLNSHIPGFDVIDLAFRYDVNGSSMLTKDLQFSLTVQNVFDTHPPFSKTSGGGVTNGNTLGRVIQFGISKAFK